MKKISVFLLIAGGLSMLTACTEDKPAEIVQTVDWYKANKAERTEMLTKCKANPGELAATPNCMNASRAASAITWGATGSGFKNVAPLKFK